MSSRDDEAVRKSMNMATNTSEFDVDELLEDDFIFSGSLIASTDLVLDDESIMPTFVSEEDVVQLLGGLEFCCNICQRTFRSKNGLNCHIEFEHFSQPEEPFFTHNNFTSFTKEIREKLLAEKLYPEDFIQKLPSFVPVRLQSFINSLIYSDLLVGKYKHDFDRFYTKYSIVFSKAVEFFPDTRVEAANFFLLQLVKTILYNVKRKLESDAETHEAECIELQKEERGPLAYVAGSILRIIHNRAAFHKKNGPWQEEIKSLFANTVP